ncbi:MAG: TetR/AcrR family transcriptional regulator, partial [Actinobacteria bacterium]|nr:TetR/AcrR family transcriptional regulator [Actinomycetota bacterium]
METVKAKKYHHGNLEDALVLAGLREAQASGTRNLGVTHLAKSVSVSPMAVYRHFSSGESLKAAISQNARENLAHRM